MQWPTPTRCSGRPHSLRRAFPSGVSNSSLARLIQHEPRCRDAAAFMRLPRMRQPSDQALGDFSMSARTRRTVGAPYMGSLVVPMILALRALRRARVSVSWMTTMVQGWRPWPLAAYVPAWRIKYKSSSLIWAFLYLRTLRRVMRVWMVSFMIFTPKKYILLHFCYIIEYLCLRKKAFVRTFHAFLGLFIIPLQFVFYLRAFGLPGARPSSRRCEKCAIIKRLR